MSELAETAEHVSHRIHDAKHTENATVGSRLWEAAFLSLLGLHSWHWIEKTMLAELLARPTTA